MLTRVTRTLTALLLLAPLAAVAAPDAPATALIRTYCGGCHKERAPGTFERISDIRKTPEGWVMTLFRMRQVHHLVLPEEAHDAIVRQLADTQGLAPSEAAPARFALERRPNAQDLDLGPELGVMCGRCHSLARVALQRRDQAEWLKHMHFHLGQYPSLEYQASGRDRPWWQIASEKLPAELAARYPFSTAAWSEWQARARADLAGRWVVVGHVPGGRDFYGTAEISRDAGGDYRARYALREVGGGALGGESHAIVYTGYE
ncbi:MAG: quinohemoprotein amine dehydrogenase subunit alpha, partial [Proteobacteria bacterium]|nr:quinohemoprotein amine dehydrogenase subunit alpha [Pseudomonadota bacterium]